MPQDCFFLPQDCRRLFCRAPDYCRRIVFFLPQDCRRALFCRRPPPRRISAGLMFFCRAGRFGKAPFAAIFCRRIAAGLPAGCPLCQPACGKILIYLTPRVRFLSNEPAAQKTKILMQILMCIKISWDFPVMAKLMFFCRRVGFFVF